MKHLDLFSGIGGFALAAQAAGIETVCFCEKDKFCQQVLQKHWPEIPIISDIEELNYEGNIDIITSGDPCQRDSRANAKRNGASMWPFSFKQIKKHKPIWVLRENVAGNIETGTLEQVERDLKSEGYHVRTYDIPALSFGAQHHRPRTWTVAYADGARLKERHDATKSSQKKPWQHTLHAGKNGIYWLGTQPPVLRRIDDVPNRVDRVRALGNAIVPEIALQFMRQMSK